MSAEFKHTPVMLQETIELLNVRPGKTYVDCTLGGGGHAEAIIAGVKGAKGPRVIGIDQDAKAIEAARIRLSGYQNISFIKDNFQNLKKILTDPVDGILFDLGVSSHQFDKAARGFSLQHDGPLDMRMDQSLPLTAADVVNNYSQEQLTKIFFEYGEERFSKRVARAIIALRGAKGPRVQGSKEIDTTWQLKEVIEKAIPSWKKRESVTRIFQALRIAVNDELQALSRALADAIELLQPGGRIVVIAYHSLEDRIVKQAFRQAKAEDKLEILTKKPLRPTGAEVAANPRSKSAKFRAGERI